MIHAFPCKSVPRSHDRLLPIIILVFTCVLFTTTVVATPIRLHGSVKDDWFQLLQADRYSTIRLPSRQLLGDALNPYPVHGKTSHSNFTSYNRAPRSRVVSDNRQLHSKVSSRVLYEMSGSKSIFTCEVQDAPFDVKPAVDKALGVVTENWRSSVVVQMLLKFQNLGNESILAAGGGAYFVKLGSPLPDDIIIPIGSAEAIRGKDLNGNFEGESRYDVLVTVNTQTPWYVGEGSASETQYDLAFVLIHEIYHNLVFTGSVVVNSGTDATQKSAYLYKGYKTRFDTFLATPNTCGALEYLNADNLEAQSGMTKEQLLAQAVCNNNLFFAVGSQPIARLYAPTVFQFGSSIYHFDTSETGEDLMFPTVRRGSPPTFTIGKKTLLVQEATLDPTKAGCQVTCQVPLPSPGPSPGPGGGYVHNPTTSPIPPEVLDIGGGRVAGLPIWGIVLLGILAFLLLLLLLLLCLLLCLRKRRRSLRSSNYRSSSYSYSASRRSDSKSRTKSDSRHGWGSVGKKTHDSWSKLSKHSRSSRHSKHSRHSGDTPRRPESERTPTKDGERCPSTGRNIYVCCCDCCRRPLQRPPPIASVHTWDPDSVVSTDKKEKRCKRKKKCRHRHDHHGVQKVVKKVCKTRVVCDDPCEAGPSNAVCTKTTRCATTVTKKPCRRAASSKRASGSNACTSSGVQKARCRPPSTRAADYCVQQVVCPQVVSTCVPKKTCTPPKTCTPRRSSTPKRTCVPTTSCAPVTTCAPTTTCGPSTTVKTCKSCKNVRGKCRCSNVVEVKVKHGC